MLKINKPLTTYNFIVDYKKKNAQQNQDQIMHSFSLIKACLEKSDQYLDKQEQAP